MRASVVMALVALMLGPMATWSAEPGVADGEIPRFKPVEAPRATQTFKLRPGIEMHLAAAEPTVESPVAMAFDENSRLFVVEMRDYPERPEMRLGRIRMLVDADGDGRYDQTTIYAKDLPWPTAVCPWDGGIFVACSPDVLYFKDTDGDGVADEKRIVVTGFAAGAARLNMQALLNSLIWGFDNRIHGCSGFMGGQLRSPLRPDAKPMDARNKGFAIEPRSGEFGIEHGGGQYALAFDDVGRMYTNSNAQHLQVLAWDYRYASNNPRFSMPPALVDIPEDGPAAEVFRISPEEPWRVLRTRWRVAGAVTGPVEGGGRASGYFTSACGVTIYRGTALGPDFSGDAFIAEPSGNLVSRKKLFARGAIVTARRAGDEQKSEFVAATDTWFRPVFLTNGPDGCLWLVDMYREYIEHPWSLPPNLKKQMDLDSGANRGRIWRIGPSGFVAPAPARLGTMATAQLVETLAHPNGWHRDTASRLLYQRQDKAAAAPLRAMLQSAKMPGALHALYALEGLGTLTEADAIGAMSPEADPALNVHALRVAERMVVGGTPSAALWAALARLADRPAAVKQQLALSLGRMKHPNQSALLADIVRNEPAEPWVRSAVLSAAQEPATLFAILLKDPAWLARAESREMVRPLLRLIGIEPDNAARAAAAARIAAVADDQACFDLAAGLGTGMQQAKGSLGALEAGAAILARAKKVAADRAASEPARVAALDVLALLPYREGSVIALERLAAGEPQTVQLAAIASLDRWTQDAVGEELIQRWGVLSPGVRERAMAVLVKRPARAKALLQAIESGAVRRADIAATHMASLRQSSDPAVRKLALKVFPAGGARRQDVVNKFLPALNLAGDAARGKAVFTSKCAQCHRAANQGHALGPDIEASRSMGKEKFLVAVLDPNRDINPGYLAYIVETEDGDQHLGLLLSESPESVTLKLANSQQVTVRRPEIQSVRPASLSMMPEGVEDGLKAQDLADLLEFAIPTGK